jgi:aryl-alcohol dehydrogenase-like predicted oxidoreductase
VIAAALANGVNLIDTADVYAATQSETIIGEALEGRRHEAILATKAGMVPGGGERRHNTSRAHILRAVEASLTRLRTDYIDLYQMHAYDPITPIEETLRTLDDLVRQGKVRYIGASNYPAWQLLKAIGTSGQLRLERFVSVQPSYSLADRRVEDELVPACLDQGVGLIAYFPLAGGLLTGKYVGAREVPPDTRAAKVPGFDRLMLQGDARQALARGLVELARERSVTPGQLALAWLVGRPGVASAIAGATRVAQVEENARAAQIVVDAEAAERLEALSAPFLHQGFTED